MVNLVGNIGVEKGLFAEVVVVIPVMNQWAWTKQTLNSLRKYSDLLKVIVVDNASTDGTKEHLQNEPMLCGYIRNNENVGVAASWNQGAKLALKKGAKYVLIINNDIKVSSGWAHKLYVLAKKFNLWCIYPKFTEQELPDDWEKQASEVDKVIPQVETNRLAGFCFMVSKEAFEQIGFFDEQFFPGWYEDTDFELRLKKAGHPAMQANNVLIHHYKNKTLDTVPEFREKMIAINRVKFNKKHGIK